jgi:hypothetical protein
MPSSETSVSTRYTRCHVPKDGILHSHRRESLKSYICKGSDQRVARQQPNEHGPTRNNGGSCVFRVRGDVTQP